MLGLRRSYKKRIMLKDETNSTRLKSLLTNKYSTMTRAWYVLFDPNCTGHCGKVHFYRCCQKVGLHVEFSSAWLSLTGGDSHRSAVLEDFDPDVVRMMRDFCDALATY